MQKFNSKKYNIVLIPGQDVSGPLISLAKKLSIQKGLTPQYYLLKNTEGTSSIPHISVFQFEVQTQNSSSMPLNKSEQKFFNLLIKHANENPTKPFEEQSIDEFCNRHYSSEF